MRARVARCALVVGCLLILVDVVRLNMTGLALLGVVALAVWLWGIGGLRREFWVTDIDEEHPDALGSLDLLEREGAR